MEIIDIVIYETRLDQLIVIEGYKYISGVYSWDSSPFIDFNKQNKPIRNWAIFVGEL